MVHSQEDYLCIAICKWTYTQINKSIVIDQSNIMSSVNVSDSTPSLRLKKSKKADCCPDYFGLRVKACSEKMKKEEADYKEHLMAILSSADSLGQVQQILSDKGELSERMKKVFDRAINQEKEEQKTASEVPIQRIIKKIRIMKKRDKHNELLELLRINEVELNKTESGIFSVITSPQRKERQALLVKQLPLVAEYLCILKKISPSSDKGAAKLRSADSWPDYPDFDTQESDTDESDSDESDSDEKTYEEFPKMEDSKFTGTEDFQMHVFQQQSFF